MTKATRPGRNRIETFRRDGLTFDVRDGGPMDGDVAVLLHGFPSCAESWSAVAERLHAAGYRTLVPDQRGYSPGARPRDLDAYAMEELVGDVLALADEAGADSFHVVGHDWGGFVAWVLAARHPGRVATLTAVSTPHPRAFIESMSRSAQLLRSWYTLSWQIPVLPEWVMTARDGAMLRTALERSGLPSTIAATYLERMLEPGALTAALNWYRAAGRSPRRFGAVADVAVPTRYLWSTDDPALGRTAAELTARHVVAAYSFVVLDGVSHWIPETAPDAIADMILHG